MMIRTKYNILFFTAMLAVLLSSSCKKETDEDLRKKEEAALQKYLDDNNITTQPEASGLYYIETTAGTGDHPVSGNTVSVHYTGKFLDGNVFDSSAGRNPIDFTLGVGQVIAGWDEGIALMKKGGKATLIIPSYLAYGPTGRNSIPPYSTLVFDVELVYIGN
jgi:FKBP-type peptidyl-prolyl cis-trans isomerase